MTTSTLTSEEFLAAAAKGDVDTVREALGAGIAADTTDAYGNSALMMAAARGQRDVCRALVDAGASVEHTNKYGMGPRNWVDWAENDAEIRNILG